MAVAQKPIFGQIFGQSVPAAAWKTIPTWYIGSSHLPFISRREYVAKMIRDAAEMDRSDQELRGVTVDSRLAPVAYQFRDTTRLYVRALDRVSHDALLTRPGPRSNPLLWVAGHLVQQRTRLLGVFGPPRQIPWEDLFGTGSIIGDLKLYPSVGELDAVWRSATDELLRRLDTVTAATLAAPSPQWLRSQDGTLLGALAFAAMHEAYHVGQMGFLRKWLGLDPIFDG